MYNWSTDTTRLKKKPDAYEHFKLEQMINFGLNGHKLSIESIKKHWDKLIIDPNKRIFLERLIWQGS